MGYVVAQEKGRHVYPCRRRTPDVCIWVIGHTWGRVTVSRAGRTAAHAPYTSASRARMYVLGMKNEYAMVANIGDKHRSSGRHELVVGQ